MIYSWRHILLEYFFGRRPMNGCQYFSKGFAKRHIFKRICQRIFFERICQKKCVQKSVAYDRKPKIPQKTVEELYKKTIAEIYEICASFSINRMVLWKSTWSHVYQRVIHVYEDVSEAEGLITYFKADYCDSRDTISCFLQNFLWCYWFVRQNLECS